MKAGEHPLDHLMWAAPNLEAATVEFERLSGVRAVFGGVHPGRGTRNALAALGPDVYLEIIAPDDAQPLAGTFGAELAALEAPRVHFFIAKANDLERLHGIYGAFGVDCDSPVEASRDVPQGRKLRWRLLIPRPGRWGRLAPIFIDWRDSAHPAASATPGCRLAEFTVGHPDAAGLGALYRALGFPVEPVPAGAPFAQALIETPKGRLVLPG